MALMFNEIQEMIDGLNATIGAMANHPELFATIAKANAKMRDALVTEGFTREEAVDIIKANGIFKANGK